jgi:CrcB protein
MIQALLVFIGGGIGALARHGVNIGVGRLIGTNFPWSTAIINVAGSFIMGLVAGYFAFRGAGGWGQHARLFIATGILGSVALSILGLFAGLGLVRALT